MIFGMPRSISIIKVTGKKSLFSFSACYKVMAYFVNRHEINVHELAQQSA